MVGFRNVKTATIDIPPGLMSKSNPQEIANILWTCTYRS